MKILNYNLSSNYQYRVQLKPDAKWQRVKSNVGILYKSVPTEISEMDHFNDLINFIPYLTIFKRVDGLWVIVQPVNENTTINNMEDIVVPIEIEDEDWDDEIPETTLDDIKNIKKIGD